ncbi:MAG: 1-acyl-sn-glycerol-3-phosphate acyltransferase [Bdellovibrio sp.]|nr:1-acyl-sn-glycerol-3-phosphate acyltransferase [Bdellovibrio sp.]
MSLIKVCALKLLDFYLGIRFRFSFHKIIIDISEVEHEINRNQPILLIANHSSWWDGFFVYEVFKKLKAKTDFKVVMLESELNKFPFFRLCGAVGLIPQDKEHNQRVFNQLKDHFVCFFPQGELRPQNLRPLIFKKGIEELMLILHPVQILSAAIHIEPFQFMKPTALIKVGSLIKSGSEAVSKNSLAALTEKNLLAASLDWTQQLYSMKDSEWK